MAIRPALWRTTPPAIFPICLGFTGMALAWRGGAGALGVSAEIGNIAMGAAAGFFLLFLLAYVAKLFARPAVLAEDLNTPAGRAGIAAIAMTFMLLGLVADYQGRPGAAIWLFGVILHFALAILALIDALSGGPGARIITPFHYLTYVGTIVAPVAGFRLGYGTLSLWLAAYSLFPFAIITVLYLRRLAFALPPPPLRPALVIVLAPVGLFAIAFGLADMEGLFFAFYWSAIVLFAMFLMLARWLCAGGFKPSWGSFTFPLAVFANMNLLAATKTPPTIAEPALWVGLIVGTAVVAHVLGRAVRDILRRDFQRASGAATA